MLAVQICPAYCGLEVVRRLLTSLWTFHWQGLGANRPCEFQGPRPCQAIRKYLEDKKA